MDPFILIGLIRFGVDSLPNLTLAWGLDGRVAGGEGWEEGEKRKTCDRVHGEG